MAAAEELTLMDCVNEFATLLGLGMGIESLFEDGASGLGDIIGHLRVELERVFLQDQLDATLAQVSGAIQQTRDSLTGNYHNAIGHETKKQLYDMLTTDVAFVGPASLDAQAGTLQTWVATHDARMGQQATSLALTIYSLMVVYYRERFRNAPDPGTATTEQENVQFYARKGVERILPLYRAVAEARIDGVGDIAVDSYTKRGVGGAIYTFYELFVTDGWTVNDDGQPNKLLGVETGQYNQNRDKLLPGFKAARDAYIKLLRTGSDADAAAFISAVQSGAPGGFDTPSATDIVAATPSYQKTGAWISSAPDVLQGLRKIAGTVDHRVAVQGSDTNLTLIGPGGHELQLGMQPGTSPSIAPMGDGYLIAFQSNQGDLWKVGPDGAGLQLGQRMGAGTSPSAAAWLSGSESTPHVSIAYRDTDRYLDVVDPPPSWNQDRIFGVMQATSPSFAVGPYGAEYIVAWHADTGRLWTHGMGPGPTSVDLADGTSPSVALLARGGYVVAFNSGNLVTLESDGRMHDWNVKMMPHTSPSVAASQNGGYRVACRDAGGALQTVERGADGTPLAPKVWNRQVAANTSPSIAALEISGYQIAFQDAKTGKLATVGDGVEVDSDVKMAENTSPSIYGLVVRPQPDASES